MTEKKQPRRPEMLASVIRELVAPILRRCPRECGIVSITEVQVSTDYAHVTFSISALEKPDLAMEYLKDHVHDMQKLLSSIPRRKIPLIRFRIDERGEKGRRIDELLASE